MGRKWLWASLVGGAVAALTALGLLSPRPSTAEPKTPAPRPAQAPVQTAQLPIGQVVLFSSGVGYFQREGAVEGNARVDLSFPVTDINDLLKSMVLRDLDGGHVATVSYDSNAPIERTLKSFAVNLTTNPSFSQVLDQARGEKIEVVLQQTNATQPGTLTGALVGCERQKHAVGGKDTVEIEMLNLWCADGLRSLKLTEVQRVRFLNPLMDSEFKKALETLALSHDTQKKSVSISFVGEGKREVRVGYVVENPIWKTSYRLVLGKEKKPFLQGWAVVENPSDEDWKDVRMALVSGRPISFQMDLYQPLYVPRPIVEMELFASLRPVAYSGGLNYNMDHIQDLSDNRAEGLSLEQTKRSLGLKKEDKALRNRAPAMPMMGRMGGMGFAGGVRKELNSPMNLASGVASMASAARLGDFFQYAIDKPVSLGRQKSALLPIINKDVEGTRLSIYNEATQPKFPLLGLRFKNTSGFHLMQGPITVFEGSSYAGDARVMDLQPGEERLISYAVDLGTEVNPVPSSDNGRLTQVKAVKGILHTTTKLRETKTYTVKNRNEQERTVLIEHPVRNDFKLVSEAKPIETASDFYRFQVKVAPGKTASQTVTEERIIRQDVHLSNLDDNRIRHFISQTITSDKVKAGLNKAMGLRWAVAKTQREIAELQRQLDTIRTDQPRLRSNLKELPQTSEAFQRIVKKFNEQETQIEKYQADIKKFQEVEHGQKKDLEDFLAAFNAE